MNYICYMFNTKILQLRLVCPTDIFCNRWPLGEVLPDKEMSFVTWNHAYYHIFYKNNCNHKPTCNKFTAQYVIKWEYITYFTFILVCSMFCTDTCHKQPLGEVLHSVEICFVMSLLNTLRPRQNGRHFADYNFKRIFLNENMWIPNTFSLKFVPKGPINNIPALVQIMAYRRPGDKPLSEPVMVRLLTHICLTRPQWVNNVVIIPQKATMS